MTKREQAKHERELVKTFPNDGRKLVAICSPTGRNVSFTGGYPGLVKICEALLGELTPDGRAHRYDRIELCDDLQSTGLFVGSATLVNGRLKIEL
jgi:hypothetical protein